MKKIKSLLLVVFIINYISAQEIIPKSYSNLISRNDSLIFVDQAGIEVPSMNARTIYKYSHFAANPTGTEKGIAFDFKDENFNGYMFFGFINYSDAIYAYPVYQYRKLQIKKGKAEIDLSWLAGKYDMIDWHIKEKGTLGYRIVDGNGQFVYDGRVNFKGTGPFIVAPTIIEGPFLSDVKPDGITIWYKTNFKVKTFVTVDNTDFYDEKESYFHEFKIRELNPSSKYSYNVICDDFKYSYTFKTAPEYGSNKKFTFAYASDCRAGSGSGEREIYGVNAYMMKRIMALASKENVAFMQFSGDLIDGYTSSKEDLNLQYANFKQSMGPFAHYTPMYVAMGNHESLERAFRVLGTKHPIMIDNFPFETESSEAIFAENFVNPVSELISEDGSKYDPDPKTNDFPSYKENVYSYTYGNTVVIVLNSNYWYAPLLTQYPKTSGNLHGYFMDNQLAWLEKTIAKFEKDDKIKHIFITQHTPAFPNGGHSSDDMWYSGQNYPRAVVAGKEVEKGIIERRDEFLDIIINKSTKVVAILTGDEHNYCKLKISDDMKRYSKEYDKEKLKLNRQIYQINNGAAGAPYYAQEVLPWSDYTSGFTTQNALVLIEIEGDSISVRVINPDTLEDIEAYSIK